MVAQFEAEVKADEDRVEADAAARLAAEAADDMDVAPGN